ncbi:MAG: hypothetical protein LBI05_04310 [Planctomycetaceae bacterium]|jgi:hypothetical protein|nr:hypothetical protein [Planctomycetaceae bacterium]
MFSKSFLYRFRFPCGYAALGTSLDETYRLPHVNRLGDSGVESDSPYDFRIGWNESGLLFSLIVSQKRQSLWCRSTQPDESDGIQICIDTRDIKDIHRASRFCHRLLFMPVGHGRDQSQPSAVWLPIHRAKEHPHPIDLSQIKMQNKVSATGYRLDVALPGKILTGFEPLEYPNLGFHFAVTDREHGNRYFLAAPPLPHDQDPSLWGTLSMIASGERR